jgi:hypothetical protein
VLDATLSPARSTLWLVVSPGVRLPQPAVASAVPARTAASSVVRLYALVMSISCWLITTRKATLTRHSRRRARHFRGDNWCPSHARSTNARACSRPAPPVGVSPDRVCEPGLGAIRFAFQKRSRGRREHHQHVPLCHDPAPLQHEKHVSRNRPLSFRSLVGSPGVRFCCTLPLPPRSGCRSTEPSGVGHCRIARGLFAVFGSGRASREDGTFPPHIPRAKTGAIRRSYSCRRKGAR